MIGGIWKEGIILYQSIYNSTVDDTDVEPWTIYGCYKGTTVDTGESVKFIEYKPQLSSILVQAIADNNLKYFVIRLYIGISLGTEDDYLEVGWRVPF